ncbi:uncharacterized protein KQ657_001452 [Scheffersomyces spartinae]|uniref:Uncharacterized protein n=1 Tax=Scheffersomyces spartinae TaxID=45513 RepID=A0A9P8AHC7_9ASCO|nr:uncharacterized protein KQ657_001452 [Scheffersomyces spartinae]KAG7192671.1 hypothetical protein KQ657_001452 [Scheffersomyces spartinae]
MTSTSTSSDDVAFTLTYVPKIAPAIVFSVVFGLMFVFQLGHERRFKAKHKDTSTDRDWLRFSIIAHMFKLAMGLEMGGYIARIFINKNPDQTAPYVILTLLTVIAPNSFTVCLILYYGEVIRTNNAQRSCLLPEWWITKMFLFQILFAVVFAISGSVLLTTDTSKYNVARALLIVCFSILLLVLVTVLLVLIHFFIKNSSAVKTLTGKKLEFEIRVKATRYYWKNLTLALIVIFLLLIVRNIYRLAGMIEGYGGQIFQHEVYQYVLDATMIAIAGFTFIACCNIATLAYVRADYNAIFGYDGNYKEFDTASQQA